MKVAAIQMNVKFADHDENFKRVEELVKIAAKDKPDIIVLPEMWNTGFFPKNVMELADNDGYQTKNLFSRLSRELNVNIIGGSIANRKGGDLYNSSYIFNKKGECIADYDKTHLFSYMKENEFFKPGSKLTTFDLDGIKCGIIICYDIRFLELVRTLSLQGINILFVAAQWPMPRINHWEILNQARAIENQIFVVGVNSCGIAGDTIFGGHSLIINPWGDILAKAGSEEEIITAELNMEILNEIRNTINVYRDRRSDLYIID